MSLTYLRAAELMAVGLLAASLSQEGSAQALFDSAAVPQEHIAVLAQPIGRAQWKLLVLEQIKAQPCLLYTSPSPRDGLLSRMPSSA